MEEQRIGAMYWNLLKARLMGIWDGLLGRGAKRSGLLPILLIVMLLVVPAIGWELHKRGRFGALKREVKGENHVVVAGPRPGGLDPIVLSRTKSAGSTAPEFLSVTLLPGLGMDVLQMTAWLPNRGEVSLLSTPTVAAMGDGTAGPRSGFDDMRGEIEVPWGGGLPGIISPLGTTLTTSWHGRAMDIPVDGEGRAGLAEGGLLATRGADSEQMTALPDGGLATAVFRGTDFDGHWPSKTDASVMVQMGASAVDLTVTAKNVGEEPEPMGIGWRPRFIVPSRDRAQAQLRLPNGEMLEIGDRVKALPTGRMLAGGGALGRFQGHAAELGSESLDESLVHLRPSAGENGPTAELRDPASGFGLRVTALSTSIRALRVAAPAGSPYVSVGMQTNFDDPFGKEWSTGENTGIATLQPGETMEWKVRVEIFPLSRSGAGGTR